MRAVLVEEVGGPENLQLRRQEVEEPAAGQLRVDVGACGVNFIDVYERTGVYQKPLPFLAGCEGAGTVSAVGPDVADVAVGDRVAWSMVGGGGYAEQVLVPADRVVPVPDDVDDQTAAAVLLQGMTAQFLCESTYPIAPGQTALVHAAAGGVGLLLTQVITAKGARVIGTASTPEKAELARQAGAADVVRYAEQDVVEEVRRLTDGRGVDVVYDGVGRSTFDASLDCLRPRGMMVLFGAASGPVPPMDPQLLNRKGSLYLTRPSLVHYIADRDELLARASAVMDRVAAGELDVRIGGRYPLEDAAQAQADLEGRRTTGKVLIIP